MSHVDLLGGSLDKQVYCLPGLRILNHTSGLFFIELFTVVVDN